MKGVLIHHEGIVGRDGGQERSAREKDSERNEYQDRLSKKQQINHQLAF